jgi:DNA-binding PadR family transcriptional regulator
MADISTQHFWPVSLALIYPELRRLEQGGLIERRDDPRGGRARSAYTITPHGVAALESWLAAEREMPVQIRDEAMLKLFFADALSDGADQRGLVERLRERNGRTSTRMREEIVPQAEHFERHGLRFVAIVARLSADLMGAAEEWLGRLGAELEEEAAEAAEKPAGSRAADD